MTKDKLEETSSKKPANKKQRTEDKEKIKQLLIMKANEIEEAAKLLAPDFDYEAELKIIDEEDSLIDAIEADDIKLSVSAGEIDVKAGKAETLKAKLSAGNIDISGRFRDVDISVSAGDIKVENEIMPNRLSCSLSAGSVRLSMPESERGFTLNYNNSAGSVESEFPLTGNLIDRKGTVKYARGESDFTVKVSAGKFRLEKKQMSNHES